MPRMALVMVNLNLLLCMILCDKKELIINYEDYEEKIVVFVHAYLFSNINGKTKCSTFTKHFVLSLALLTQNKMCILSPLNML